MKELKKEKVIEEIVGYQANDGKVFMTKEECEKYEKSAVCVITEDFEKVLQDKPFAESNIFENYGYGSDEFMMGIVDIKDTNVLEIVNRYLNLREAGMISPEFIGKKVLFNIGNVYESKSYCQPCPRTMDMLVKGFIKDIQLFFGEEYILDEIIRKDIAYRVKNAIEYYEKDAYTAEDMYHQLKSIYELIKDERKY